MKKIRLGKTEIEVPKLGLGTGTHGINGSSDQTLRGAIKFANLLRHAHEKGVYLWDTAEPYGNHAYFADTLHGLTPHQRPMDRSSVLISTKVDSRTASSIAHEIDCALTELRTEYVDMLAMHCLTIPNWIKEYDGAIEVLKDAKASSKARAIGISCHELSALECALDADWLDYVIARVNYDGTNMDAPPEQVLPVLRELHDQGKGVLAIKVLGQGVLLPDVHKAISFVYEQECIDALIIGMVDEDQVDQNVKLVEAMESEVLI